MEYLKVANILAPVGLKGEMKVYTTSTNKELRYKNNGKLFLDTNPKQELHIEYFKEKEKNIDILKFKEFNSREDIEKILKIDILVIKDNNDLKKDEYFYSDLKNINCYDENGKFLGLVNKVIDYTGIVSLEIKKENNKMINIPFNDYFIIDVSLNENKIIIHTIEGLFDEN